MKKMTKFLLIVSIICIVLGGVIMGVGLFCGGKAVVGWDKNKHRFVELGEQDYVTLEKTRIDDFKNIDIDLDNESVYLIPDDDFYIEYSVYLYDKDETLHSVNNDTLKVKMQKDVFVFNFGIDFNGDKDTYVKIYYPKDTDFESININLDMGNLEVKGCNSDYFTADLDMGSLEVKDCKFNDASVYLDMGSLDFDDVSLGKLDAELDMGSADLSLIKDKKKSYGYDLEVDMGSIEINDKEKKNTYRSDGDNVISIYCDMGDIEINEK